MTDELTSVDLDTHPTQFSQFGQHNYDGRVVFPQHSPEIFGRLRQRTLRRDVCSSVPVSLHIPMPLTLDPFHAGNFYFESQATLRAAKFREIFFHKIERVFYRETEIRK